ncbi:putative 10 kDa secreted protein [Trichonephila clavata]|uniref:Putative 10 kDa secreted protein n=1 Tax=Trichonephila clavata TaxID=2740835 RepID=A0A8X6FX94_TRICU|nr:putative 10 kDa secreted protein [Trichonephila clavata]
MRDAQRPHKRCRLLYTAGRWPRKSASAKECVTTHLPKQPVLKMDGAPASSPYPALSLTFGYGERSRRVAAESVEGQGANPTGASAGADLGGSSKYSSENLED